ncbi:plasminogen-like [Carcharodon carcharias]|uniref:plasminogen-like n=1 Tax=Carcharodon carcharias TaxID=13397 RepID=UPI001B7F4B76|nr:plasminogen-like [Carcharodon carcharias]
MQVQLTAMQVQTAAIMAMDISVQRDLQDLCKQFPCYCLSTSQPQLLSSMSRRRQAITGREGTYRRKPAQHSAAQQVQAACRQAREWAHSPCNRAWRAREARQSTTDMCDGIHGENFLCRMGQSGAGSTPPFYVDGPIRSDIPDGYVKTEGAWIYSARESRYPGVSVEKCAAKCNLETQFLCRAFLFTQKNHECFTTADNSHTQLVMRRTNVALYEKQAFLLQCKSGNGVSYRGTATKTASGRTCQRWASNTPHKPNYTPANSPHADLEENYCRNPDNDTTGPWCYTRDASKRWEYCQIQNCEDGCMFCSGENYHGKISQTEDGVTCQRWDSQTPHFHEYNQTFFPDKYLEENYCRNPDGEPRPWCFTTDSKNRWAFCNVPRCNGEPPAFEGETECFTGKGQKYRGTVSTTISGIVCQRWDTQVPHLHSRTPDNYPCKGLEGNHCRNPDNEKEPWCYTTNPDTRWEYCQVQKCGLVPPDSPDDCSPDVISHDFTSDQVGVCPSADLKILPQDLVAKEGYVHNAAKQAALEIQSFVPGDSLNGLKPWVFALLAFISGLIGVSKASEGFIPCRPFRSPDNFLWGDTLEDEDFEAAPQATVDNSMVDQERIPGKNMGDGQPLTLLYGDLSQLRIHLCRAQQIIEPFTALHQCAPYNIMSADLGFHLCPSLLGAWLAIIVEILIRIGHLGATQLILQSDGNTAGFQSATPYNHNRPLSSLYMEEAVRHRKHLMVNQTSETLLVSFTTLIGRPELNGVILTDCIVGNGVTYRGTRSTTSSGRTCQNWSVMFPHSHRYLTPETHPKAGLVGNYCRNPDADISGPWCYTTDPSKQFDYCDDIPSCAGIICGRSTVKPKKCFGRIVGGCISKPHSWPWQISLCTNFGVHFCGGTLIDTKWVLTAKHCMERSLKPSAYKVYLGIHRQAAYESSRQIIDIAKIVLEPSGNDIALLKLERPAVLNDKVTIICLPTEGYLLPNGADCYVTGWGETQGTGRGNILKEAGLPVIGNNVCNRPEYLNGTVKNSELCAQNYVGCPNDGGGPLVCPNSEGRYILQGVTSWGLGYAKQLKPGVYVRVSFFIDWIKNTIKHG